MELFKKHGEILGRRAELLKQMENRREQLKILKKQWVKESEAAHHRNTALLQELQKIEDHLRGRGHLPHPNVLALEPNDGLLVLHRHLFGPHIEGSHE
ncbi:uncharacterized protein C3orf14 homolog isoform X3 [Xiphias gladius]|uniref:uncharacterized protein C3orf14 homolog isoform X3 n=1 Tax=Xiphias gladius TaxID=8245 RepID=UPI001A99CBBD|nr:uncharacterized protein C3orf14 homolog isoform X3 [Xiphias gladius]